MWNIKLDRRLVSTGILFVFSLLMMSGTHAQQKLPMKSQRKAIVDNFRRGRQYERLEGHLLLDLSAYNGSEDVPIQDYFRFVHAVNLPPELFEMYFRCG